MEPYIGEIRSFAINYPPNDDYGWLPCNGQLLSVASYPTLFSLLGTTFGGDGKTTFNLPDLRGRSMVHTNERLHIGMKFGSELTHLGLHTMPSHNHTAMLNAEQVKADQKDPSPEDKMLSAAAIYTSTLDDRVALHSGAVVLSETGGDGANAVPFSNRDPELGLILCIATKGIYPDRH